jgi:hypothetical protein
MRVLLCQLDGKLPNIALMRISTHFKRLGHSVELQHGAEFEHRGLFDPEPDRVYASAIFRVSIPLAERLRRRFPNAIIGGTGVDPARKGELVPLSLAISPKVTRLEDHGFHGGEGATDLDYSLYPNYTASIGFTQRGCRLACSFCVVGEKEGPMREVQPIEGVWRGQGHPKHLHLLDNDFFVQPNWQSQVTGIMDGGFKVSFNQGINARFLTNEAAYALSLLDYRDDSMTVKRIYTAWDNLKDEHRLFDGLRRLERYGVKPDHIMVYMLCGYWPGETQQDRDYRRARLREFGARPYPMPFVRTKELVGFQRWVIGAYDKRFSWEEWVRADYRPEKLGKLAA